ncbi:MAG: DUF2147 domain-containing protein [Rhodobacteraceae bacterium]|nr:DUF2147 domain-containing protein [Paracoccaceae bacterium]
MNKLVAALAFSVIAGTSNADPLEGIWQTEADDGAYAHVTIAPCGDAFCGVLSRTFNADGEYKSPNLGRQIVIDMVPNGPGNYKGKVWRPSNDKIYIGKIELDGDKMKLAGCIAGGLLCKKQSWQRLK